MNRLIICNTNYQIIVAIQLKLTLFSDDLVKIVVTDHILNGKKLVENLQRENIFEDVEFLHTMAAVKEERFFAKIWQSIQYGLGKSSTSIKDIDELITYNFDVSYYNIINALDKSGHPYTLSKMEEGILSYNTDFYITGFRNKLIQSIRKIRHKNDVRDEFHKLYCFYPDLVKIRNEWDKVNIPPVQTDSTIKAILKSVFQCPDLKIKEKYIFFASSSDVDNNSYGETEIILKLSKIVGKDNLLIKTHPRDNRSVYSELGLHVMENSSIPWEVYQIVNDFTKKIFLTITSGAFISVETWMPSNNEYYFLYPEVSKFPENYEKYVERINNLLSSLHGLGACDNINKCTLSEFEDAISEKSANRN